MELTDAYDLECVIEQIVSEYKDRFTLDEITEFFNSISLYYYYDADSDDEDYRLTEEQQVIAEDELYDADIGEIVRDIYNGM